MSTRAPRLPSGPPRAPALRSGSIKVTIERESRSTLAVRMTDGAGGALTLLLTPGGAGCLGALLSRLALAPIGTLATCHVAADQEGFHAPPTTPPTP